MAVDTPARIAIIGAGPIGLEAALYARFLGYDVDVYEQGQLGEHLQRWGHVQMFTPFEMNSSSLGRSAIRAQDNDAQLPAADELLTGQQWLERYLRPLASTDLLSSCIHEHHRVLAVGREEALKSDMTSDRGELTFRVLLENDAQSASEADVVIDTSGVFSQPNYLGPGGCPAVGETAVRDAIDYQLPDILGQRRPDFENQHTLLIGAGMSAATSAAALSQLMDETDATRVTWIVHREPTETGPIRLIEDDPLPARRQLSENANRIALSGNERFSCHAATWVEAVRRDEASGTFHVQLAGEQQGEFQFDRIIANVGYHPERELYRQLQVHECYASEGPMKLAARLMEHDVSDCMQQQPHGADSLTTSEPDFYILGSKSYGRNSHFLYSIGLAQIQQLFTLIADRETLDLYATSVELE